MNSKKLSFYFFLFIIPFSLLAVDDSDIFLDAVFFTAVKKSNYEKTLEMIEKGVLVNKRDSKGMTALAYSLKNDDEKMFDLLLSRGAKIEQNILDKTSNLIFYISSKKFKLLEKIIDAGANPNHQDSLGRTPLMHAIEYRNIKAINFFMKIDFDASITDYGGKSIFDYAESSRDMKIRRLFKGFEISQ
tara:strand:- start:1455 stop:2018 length:564 start_codon:yes stop_codon:yes gene_type:complete